ncbi:FxSxx-COOH system tetratricopeptide repeat protein [Actinocorallia sp. API 0066]|uniref:FxSxx-COOH system tetratricopeptide repeat protein n=1 Tax=Actinocorallia sp. API 0066 TaxID=2896846 RepID=UPI001E48F0F1|nr:FxSxx-COOH system tetratricopeptide repeat protein [Actinocorallia sp. API 0066]MCD0453508.1 FxSxx-COOH system tetratricopeptide repeat protein [Actinocorallia sp. API 0066]
MRSTGVQETRNRDAPSGRLLAVSTLGVALSVVVGLVGNVVTSGPLPLGLDRFKGYAPFVLVGGFLLLLGVTVTQIAAEARTTARRDGPEAARERGVFRGWPWAAFASGLLAVSVAVLRGFGAIPSGLDPWAVVLTAAASVVSLGIVWAQFLWRRRQLRRLPPALRALLDVQGRGARAAHRYSYSVGSTPPLMEIYVEQQSERLGAPRAQGGPLTLAQMLAASRHCLVLAEPGVGKSTAVTRVLQEQSAWWLTARRSADPATAPYGSVVPVLLPPDLHHRETPAEALAAECAARTGREVAAALFEGPPPDGERWLVLIDGIDHVFLTRERTEVLARLGRWMADGAAHHRFLITTRPLLRGELGLLGADTADRYVLQKFDEAGLRTFVERWVAFRTAQNVPGIDPEPITVELFLASVASSSLSALVRIPLIASITALLLEWSRESALPTSRAGLYEVYIRHLLDSRHMEAARPAAEFEGAGDRGRAAWVWLHDNLRPLLEGAADLHLSSARPGVHECAVRWVEDSAPPGILRGVPAWREALGRVLVSTSLIVPGPGGLRFLHPSFAEYLAAGPRGRAFALETWLADARNPDSRALALFVLARMAERNRGASLGDTFAELTLDRGAADVLVAGAIIADGIEVAPESRDRTVAALFDMLRRDDQTAADALGVLLDLTFDADVRARLVAFAADPAHPDWIRADVAEALCGVDRTQGVRLCRRVLAVTSDTALRHRVLLLLIDLGEATHDELQRAALTTFDPAAETTGFRAVRWFRDMADDPAARPRDRLAALTALAVRDDAVEDARFEEALLHPETTVQDRLQAARAVVRADGERATAIRALIRRVAFAGHPPDVEVPLLAALAADGDDGARVTLLNRSYELGPAFHSAYPFVQALRDTVGTRSSEATPRPWDEPPDRDSPDDSEHPMTITPAGTTVRPEAIVSRGSVPAPFVPSGDRVIWHGVPDRNPRFVGREHLLTRLTERSTHAPARPGDDPARSDRPVEPSQRDAGPMGGEARHPSPEAGDAGRAAGPPGREVARPSRGAGGLRGVLVGEAGAGKTQVAVEHVHRSGRRYGLVCWVRAVGVEEVRRGLAGMAGDLGLAGVAEVGVEEAADGVVAALRDGAPVRDWLVVLDGADGARDLGKLRELVDALASGPGDLLVTSRFRWPAGFAAFTVEGFSRQESVEFLRGSGMSEEDAYRLAEALGDQPLALEQVRVLGEETMMTVGEARGRLLSSLEGVAPADAEWSAVRPGALIRFVLGSLGADALGLMRYLAVLGDGLVPFGVLRRPGAERRSDGGVLADPVRLERAVAELVRLRFVERERGGVRIGVNPSVKEVAREGLAPERLGELRAEMLSLIDGYVPDDPLDPAGWPRFSAVLGHALAAGVVERDEEWARGLALRLARYLRATGDYAQARDLLRALINRWSPQATDAEFGSGLAGAWGLLVRVLVESGEVAKAGEAARVVVARLDGGAEAGHSAVLAARRALAVRARVRGEARVARAEADAILTAVEEAGPQAGDALDTLHDAAGEALLRGDDLRAFVLYRREANAGEASVLSAADLLDRVLSEQAASGTRRLAYVRTRALAGLARTARMSGDTDEASRMSSAVVAHAEAQLGGGHPLTLRAVLDRAVVDRLAGRHAVAVDGAETARAGFAARFGADHPETLAADVTLVQGRRAAGLLGDDDVEAATETLARGVRRLGPAHPYLGLYAASLASVLRHSGRPDEALVRDTEALGVLAASLGEEHVWTLGVIVHRCSDLAALGRWHDALDGADEVLRILSPGFGRKHPTELACVTNLARDLLSQGMRRGAYLGRDYVGLSFPDGSPVGVFQRAAPRRECDLDVPPL